jgi:hypothetical protein
MRLAPWRNPLVGTAFMLRARRGNLVLNITLYIIFLVMGMAAWQYYISLNPDFKGNPHKMFLLILFGGQCFISGLMMLGSAGSAIKNEVMNKTLDFQRIASVSPWDILVGKLLGPPVLAYLLAISAIPVAVFTLLNGVAGVDLLTLILSWVQMLTFLFLVGSCVIQNTLQITSTKGTGAAPGFGIFMGILGLTVYSTFAHGDSASYLANPARMSIGALLTPLTAFSGISVENPWAAQFSWFNIDVPCLIFTPVAHIVISWFVLSIMARRLGNVESSPFGKKQGYLFIVLVDLLVAGVLNSCGTNGRMGAAGMLLPYQLIVFFLIHLVISVVFFVSLTPRLDWVWSWAWRFRESGRDTYDSLVHDRAPNSMALMVNVLSAALAVSLLMVMAGEPLQKQELLIDAGLATLATVLFVGALYQALHLISRKYGTAYFILILMFVVAAPALAGSLLCASRISTNVFVGQGLLYLTPITQFLRFTVEGQDSKFFEIVPYPLIAGYFSFTVLLLLFTWNRVNQMSRRVERVKSGLVDAQALPAAT